MRWPRRRQRPSSSTTAWSLLHETSRRPQSWLPADPASLTSSLFADANHEVLIDHPDVAVELLARAVPPVVSANPAAQTVQYTDRVKTVTISADNAASELPLTASTEWSLDGGAFQPGLPDWLAWTESGCTADGIWGSCGWTLAGVDTVQVPAGTYLVRTTVTEGAQSSVVDVTIVVKPGGCLVQYTGETIAPIGTNSRCVRPSGTAPPAGYPGVNPETGPDATLGDLTKIWVEFDAEQLRDRRADHRSVRPGS